MARLRGEIVARERLGGCWRIRIRVPGWQCGTPGQFAMLQPARSGSFLARAFSLHEQRDEDVSFLVAPVGRGSDELCRCRGGEVVWVLGPLGRGFPLEEAFQSGRRVVAVAGGVGIAPFPPVLERLRGLGAETSVPGADESVDTVFRERPDLLCLLGFRDSAQAEVASVLNRGVVALQTAGWRTRVELASEDGGVGLAGPVTDLVAEMLKPGDRLLVCGPEAMCRAVWVVVRQRQDVRAWFSLETRMACGFGSCHGCAVPLADGSLVSVCRRGPVFGGEEVFGDDGDGGDAL
jgi:dihydroorotate dehydrogenase electron transfer subunit